MYTIKTEYTKPDHSVLPIPGVKSVEWDAYLGRWVNYPGTNPRKSYRDNYSRRSG